MREPIVISGPLQEPINLAEVKEHCRIDGTEEDSLLESYIASAREYLEYRTSRTIHEKVLELSLDEWPEYRRPIILPYATPLNAVLSFAYTDSSGSEFSWNSFVEDRVSLPGKVLPQKNTSYPSVELTPSNGIRIRYRAGLKLGEVPSQSVKIALLMLVAGMYENRESEGMESGRFGEYKPSYGVEAFIGRLQISYAT